MIYSTKLAEINATAPGSFTGFTAGAGAVTVIRDISGILTALGSPCDGVLEVNGLAIFYTGKANGFQNFHQECRIVLNAGDVVSWAQVTGSATAYLSGYVLS